MKKFLLTLVAVFGLTTAAQAQLNLELSPGYNWVNVDASVDGLGSASASGDVSSLQLGLHYDFIEGKTMASLGARAYMFGIIEGGSVITGGVEAKLGLDAVHAIAGIDTDGGFIYGIGTDIPLGDSKFALAPSIRFQSATESGAGYSVKASGAFAGLGVNYQF